MSAFALTDHTHVYADGTVALQQLTLTPASRSVALLGPNGAGKTTLLQLLATTLAPSGGQLEVLGTRVGPSTGRGELRALRRRIGYLPQTTPVVPRFSVHDQVAYACWLRDVTAAEAGRKASQALARVGLEDLQARRVSRLSGGQQRRVAVAMAIAGDPDLLILDEPTTGLDPEQRVALRRLLVELTADVTVVISTHHTDDVAAICDSVAIIADGGLQFAGTSQELEQRGGANDDRAATPMERGYLDTLANR